MNVRFCTADELPCADRREIFRYARATAPSDAENALLDACLAELLPHLTYRIAWESYPVRITGNHLDLGFAQTDSADLTKNLRDCGRVVLFAATIGFAPDRMIQKYRTDYRIQQWFYPFFILHSSFCISQRSCYAVF